VAVGYFDAEGDPRVTVEIVSASGTHHFDFIVDTVSGSCALSS
jgi:hypothetical protein